MSCDDLLMRFLDGELSGKDEEEALERIGRDPDARRLLRFDFRLREALWTSGGRYPPRVPDGFEERVMSAIEEREAASSAPVAETGRVTVQRLLRRLVREATRPRSLSLRWRPATALGSALALAAVLALVLLGPIRPGTTGVPADQPSGVTTAEADSVRVRFVYQNEAAASVAVAGDFSNWEPIPLSRHRRDGRVIWAATIPLPRGEHRYMYVVDSVQWVTDPLATTVLEDGFGNLNAILSL